MQASSLIDGSQLPQRQRSHSGPAMEDEYFDLDPGNGDDDEDNGDDYNNDNDDNNDNWPVRPVRHQTRGVAKMTGQETQIHDPGPPSEPRLKGPQDIIHFFGDIYLINPETNKCTMEPRICQFCK